MEEVNTISFCKSDYMEYNERIQKDEFNEYQMHNDIHEFVRIAIKNGYQMRIWYDGLTVVIEYDYLDRKMCGKELVWLGEDEYISKYGEDEE